MKLETLENLLYSAKFVCIIIFKTKTFPQKGVHMKKRELAIVSALLTAVSAACIKGMKAVGKKLEKKDTTFEELKTAEDGTLR